MTDPIGEDEDAEGIVEFWVFVPCNRKEIIVMTFFILHFKIRENLQKIR